MSFNVVAEDELGLNLYSVVSKEGLAVRLSKFPVKHAFSTTVAGNMSYNWGPKDEVDRNAERFYRLVGLDRHQRVHILPQHGADIVKVSERDVGTNISCDGFVTTTKNLALSLAPADCFPLILTAQVHLPVKFVGLFHIGLKGALQGFVKKAVRYAVKKIGVPPHDIIAGIGPGIHPCCYRGIEIVSRVLLKDPNRRKFIGFKRMSFDLPGLIRHDLQGEGIRNILDINLCTSCSVFVEKGGEKGGRHIFFSHRRAQLTGEEEGRSMTIVTL